MSEDLTRNLPSDDIGQILFLLRGVDARLTGLEERVDRRLMETRPIWEQVLVRLDGIDTRLDGIDTRLDGIDTRLDGIDARLDGLDKSTDNLGLDMRAGFKRLERQMGQLATEYIAVRTDQSDLEKRMDRLEDKLEAKPVG
jgi:chromosome segregation ATPase